MLGDGDAMPCMRACLVVHARPDLGLLTLETRSCAGWSLAVLASPRRRARRAGTSTVCRCALCVARCRAITSPSSRRFWLLAPLSAAEQTCSHCAPSPSLHSVPSVSLYHSLCAFELSRAVRLRDLFLFRVPVRRLQVQGPPSLAQRLSLRAPFFLHCPLFLRLCCASALQFFASCSCAVLRDEEIVSGDDEPKLRCGQREGAAGLLRQGEAEAVQVGRRPAVALLLPGERRRPAPELLRGRPPPATVGVAEGTALVERRGRRRRARGAGARRAGRRGCGGRGRDRVRDQEGGLRSGVRAAAAVPLAAGHRHGDDAGREQGAVQGQHPARYTTGHAGTGGARDPRTAAPTGFLDGRRLATGPSGSGPRRRLRVRRRPGAQGTGARCADDDGRVARDGVGRRRARQAHGQVPARGDENTGLGKPATAKGGAANEDHGGQGGEDEAAGAGEDGEQAGLGAGGGQGEARAGGGQAEPARRAGRGQGGRAEADGAPAVVVLRVLAQAAADVQLRGEPVTCR